MSRLNTMYPDDEFLKNISDMMGKLDNKNETEIKQEIEQIGYKEFYRYSKEKDVYIKQLKEENKQLKEQLESSERARKQSMWILGEYRHYTMPTEEQNRENEDIVDKAYNNLILKQDIDKGE